MLHCGRNYNFGRRCVQKMRVEHKEKVLYRPREKRSVKAAAARGSVTSNLLKLELKARLRCIYVFPMAGVYEWMKMGMARITP